VVQKRKQPLKSNTRKSQTKATNSNSEAKHKKERRKVKESGRDKGNRDTKTNMASEGKFKEKP
jgi:hypothetical protein